MRWSANLGAILDILPVFAVLFFLILLLRQGGSSD